MSFLYVNAFIHMPTNNTMTAINNSNYHPSFLPNITLDRKQEIIDFVIELNKNANKYNMRSKHIYRKLICTLMKHKEEIRCSEDLDDIKNMGTKTKEQIVRKIFNESNTTVDLQNNAPFEHCSIIVEDVKGIESNAAKTDTKVEGTVSQSRQKKYLPSYKSGAYAILKVLYKEDGMSKKLICHKGNKYSNTEFSTASRLSAWNGIKTLTKKELVYKDDKKYYLTEDGKDLCKELFYNESTIIQDSEVKLVIDSREMKSRRERLFFQSYFDTVEIQHMTKNIELGDFIWTCGDDVLDFIIERKKGSDFCSSISDGRMKNQKQRLLDSGIGNIYYIVENLKESDMNRIGRNYVYSHLNSLKNENITVIETDDINETAKVVQLIDEKVKSDMYVSNIICVEPKKVSLDEYIDKGTKNNNYNIKDGFTIILCTVRGLNAGKAQVIADKYLTYANFLKCSKNLSFLDELANIEYEGQKIGLSMANRINDQICTQ